MRQLWNPVTNISESIFMIKTPLLLQSKATGCFRSLVTITPIIITQWCTQEFFSGEGRGGDLQIQLRKEGRENGDLGGGSPLVRGSTQFAKE
jgi:hypothetical protein